MTFFRTFLSTIGFGALLLVLLNAWIDPLRYFSDESIAEFEGQTRYRYPGMIRNKDYDTVLLGTSMAQNFVMADIDRLFDSRSLLLAISGASLREQALAIELALRTGKPRTVIWEIYEGALITGPDEVRKGASFPFYMYDDSLPNDIFYAFNFSNTARSIEALKDYLTGERVDQDSWLTMEYRSDRYRHGCPELMQNQLSGGGLLNSREDRFISDELIAQNVEDNLLSVIRRFPQVEFILYAPPVSYAHQALLQRRQPGKFAAMQRAKKIAYPGLLAEPNVRLYEFYSDRKLTANLDNYRDLMHFSGALSQQLLERIAGDENRVRDDWQEILGEYDKSLSAYPVEELLEQCLEIPSGD